MKPFSWNFIDGFHYLDCSYLLDTFLDREKDEILNSDDNKLATEKQQEQEKSPLSEEIKDNKEGAINESEEKEEDKVCYSLLTFCSVSCCSNYIMAEK